MGLYDSLNQALVLVLTLSMPAIVAATAVGLVVGLIQALTQIQDQTLPQAVKLAAVGAVIMLGGAALSRLAQALHGGLVLAQIELAAGPHHQGQGLAAAGLGGVERGGLLQGRLGGLGLAMVQQALAAEGPGVDQALGRDAVGMLL